MAIASIWSRIAQVLPLLRLTPFDISTEQGRSDERHRRVLLSAAASVLAKGVSIAAALISVPLTLHFLGAERYGVWITISSFVGILAFADLGIGNGLMNAVADAHGRQDQLLIRRYISSGFLILSGIALMVVALFAIAYPYVHWDRIFNVTSSLARRECGLASAAFVVCFAIAMPMGIVQRAQMGLQQSFAANLWQCAASLLSLLAILFAIWIQASLPMLVLALMGAPLIVNLINTVIYFLWIEPDMGPNIGLATPMAMLFIARTGVLFFVLQIVGTVAYSADNLIIAQVHGAAAVAAYAVADRMFSVIPMIATMVVYPLWPAYGEAKSRGDYGWIWRTLDRSLVGTALFALLFSVVFVVGGPVIIRLWVGHTVSVSFALLLGMGIWKILQSTGAALSSFMNGMNIVRFQVITSTLGGVFSILLKIYLVEQVGIAGVPWTSAIAYVAFGAIPMFFYIRGVKRQMSHSAGAAEESP